MSIRVTLCTSHRHHDGGEGCTSTIPLIAAERHALLEAVGNGALAGGVGLSESGRATEWAGSCTVADADDADVVSAADGGIAGHTRRHLDGQGEIGVGSQRETLDTKTGHVLGDLSGLEGVGVSASGSAVNLGSEGTSTILVDLCSSLLASASDIICQVRKLT